MEKAAQTFEAQILRNRSKTKWKDRQIGKHTDRYDRLRNGLASGQTGETNLVTKNRTKVWLDTRPIRSSRLRMGRGINVL